MDVASAVGRVLADAGTEHVFGVIGSGNFAVTRALVDAGASYVAARHECAAVAMADGYARATGKLGVATVHQGPGLTNALTGLTEAAKSRTPLLLLAADTSTGAVRSNFRIDQEALVRAVGAVAERVHRPESALGDVARAYRRATVDRAAVALMLPLDVQAGEVPAPPATVAPTRVRAPAPSQGAINDVADLLEEAEKPVIVAGRGAVLSGARESLEQLGDQIGAVLATSANGHGLFAGGRYAVGICGGFSSPFAGSLFDEADLVLSFGASLNMWTTRHGALFRPPARVVQVDVDGAAVGANVPVAVGVVADAAEAAGAIVAELDRRGTRRQGFRTDGLAEAIAARRWRDEPYDDASNDAAIDPRTLSIALDDLLPTARTVVTDSGHFMGWPAAYLSVPDAAGFVFNQAFQSVGLGLGAAIGAAVGRPDRITVAALGDGGAMMALGEMETAARLGLPLLAVVYNDAAYGAEVHHFAPRGADVDIARFPDVDFAALGRAAGAAGVTVRTKDDLATVGDWLGRPSGPLVVDAKVTPHVVAGWLEEAFRAH